MPREIADSDDELDIAPPRPTVTEKNADKASAPPSTHGQDPLADTEFDKFLSPTQRLSSFDGNQDAGHDAAFLNLLDSSTDRFLKEVAPAPSSFESSDIHPTAGSDASSMGGKQSKSQHGKDKAGKKRSRTQIEHDDKSLLFQDMSSGSRKRGKTYASGRSTMSAIEAADFQTLITGTNGNLQDDTAPAQSGPKDVADTVDPAALVSVDPRSEYTSPLDLSLSLPAVNNPNAEMLEDGVNTNQIQTPGYSPPQAYTSHSSFFGANLYGGTTSRSSMGGYQSFSINPNELGMGYGEINPFGRLSQVTDLDEADSEETRAIANIFRNSGANISRSAVIANHVAEPGLRVDDMQEMQTSPVKGAELVNAPELFNTQESLPNESPTFSQITDQDEETGNAAEKQSDKVAKTAGKENAVAEQPEVAAKAPPKKRGRKPKQKKGEETEADEQNDIDELHTDEPHVTRAIRAGTVDSVSNASEISHGTTSSKTAKQRKSRKADMLPPEVMSKKLPSSDLGLNDKNVIGLSPERYVPRPSKRRGRVEPEPEPMPEVEANEPQESSQTKTPASREEQPIADETPSNSTQAKGKRGRKSKVKRAKTSAAALVKKGNDFLDEDEEEEAREVLFMDERPAKVKFQPLPEFSPDRKLKKETAEQEAETNAAENKKQGPDQNNDEEEGEVVRSTERAKITVEVPPLRVSDSHQELPPPVPEPKKRGRKRKKAIEEPVKEPQEQVDGRPVLAAKDGNAQHKAGRGVESSSKFVDMIEGDEKPEEDEENTRPTDEASSPTKRSTPTKSTTPVPTSAKPTHSPLKPTSTTPLFNARTRIGLSKRHSIPSLLRRVDRNKEPPKAIERKEKLTKAKLEAREQERIAREEAEAEGREYVPPDLMRGKDGMLVEWDF